MKEASHKRPCIVWFQLYVMSRIGKSTETFNTRRHHMEKKMNNPGHHSPNFHSHVWHFTCGGWTSWREVWGRPLPTKPLHCTSLVILSCHLLLGSQLPRGKKTENVTSAKLYWLKPAGRLAHSRTGNKDSTSWWVKWHEHTREGRGGWWPFWKQVPRASQRDF